MYPYARPYRGGADPVTGNTADFMPGTVINGPGHGPPRPPSWGTQQGPTPSIFTQLVQDERFLWGLGVGTLVGWVLIPRIF